jgi:hypothetical protein
MKFTNTMTKVSGASGAIKPQKQGFIQVQAFLSPNITTRELETSWLFGIFLSCPVKKPIFGNIIHVQPYLLGPELCLFSLPESACFGNFRRNAKTA